jgi:hypothetical protein
MVTALASDQQERFTLASPFIVETDSIRSDSKCHESRPLIEEKAPHTKWNQNKQQFQQLTASMVSYRLRRNDWTRLQDGFLFNFRLHITSLKQYNRLSQKIFNVVFLPLPALSAACAAVNPCTTSFSSISTENG